MAELLDGKGIKAIAFYLPQFHAIPENDKAWGKGFTEWVNVKKAAPLFEGHIQPKRPKDGNYYCLLDDDTKIWQADLAKQYGLFGFCYYHYWFKDGKQLLEKPAEQMLRNPKVDIPFCFSWANENWSKLWDGGERELIAEQDYGGQADWEKHLEYLLPFFKDRRYITLNGRPVFLIYKPELFPDIDGMLDFWNRRAKEHGLPGICFMIQNSSWYYTPNYNLGKFEYQIKFHPFFAMLGRRKDMDELRKKQRIYQVLKHFHLNRAADQIIGRVKRARTLNQSYAKKLEKLDYDGIWEEAIRSEAKPWLVEGAFTDWDNTARKKNGYVCIGASPDKFERYLERLFKKVKENGQLPTVFINAWNEWCEGAYLEPDETYDCGYLQALKAALEKQK